MTGVAAEVGSTANNYQILARLAIGGMAEIFLARGVSATGVERYCVLKRILRERANDAQFVRMFLDEARLAAQLQHPNVAQVYDIGKLGDSFFFTMEYVHGETVRALLHRARSLRREVPLGIVLTIAAGAAAGLHHAHERLGHDGRPLGIVHRDVSPSNLMVSYEGGVKVVDFGVAKAENRAQETRSGTVKGKIAYLSPEQCRGGGIDRRSDLFSLGIVFWEMLTCERLYKRPSDFDNMTAIVTEDPIPPSTRRKQLPPELDRIALKLLAKDPAARYQTADELVEELEAAAVQCSTMISPSSLGRFMRDVFGQRPEPWFELDATTQQVPVDNVTVTSEPLPLELLAPPVDDALLANVGDLKPSQALTAPAMPLARSPAASPVDRPDLAMPLARSPAASPVDRPDLAMPGQVPAPRQTELYPSVPSVPYAAAPAVVDPLSGSHPSHSMHLYAGTGSQVAYPPQARSRGWTLVAIVAAAAVVGSLTVWLVMRGGAQIVVPDAAVGVVVTPIAADAAESVDAAEPSTVVKADAAVVAAIDAVPAPPDAAVAVTPPPDEIKLAVAQKRYAEAVALCTQAMAAEHVAMCVLAACREKLEARAKQWFGKLGTPAKKAVAAQCRDAGGIELVPKPRPVSPPVVKPPADAGVIDPCAANPMACQR